MTMDEQPTPAPVAASVIDLTTHQWAGQLLNRERAVALGKAQRQTASRRQVAELADRPADFDVMAVIEQSNVGRMSQLLPVRAKRMSVSPFTFFRGMPLLMAQDLSREPNSGLHLQICGDCHVLNFGGFASPERNLLFGINDFDETVIGPFEWDLKRLAASIVIAAQDVGLTEQEGRDAVRVMMTHYREHLRHMMTLSPLQVWYECIDADDLLASTENNQIRKKREKNLSQAYQRTTASVLPKLTERDATTGQRCLVDEPPLMWHPTANEPFAQQATAFFGRYRGSLKHDRQVLFDRYRLTDVALKVVGVGSVGTRCAVALFEDGDHDPLILQMKEARPSVLAAYLPTQYTHQGQRVVQGQQMLQAASDIFLGWATAGREKHHYFVRQLRDMKVSVDLDDMDAVYLQEYARSCGMALAHAHGKSGNAEVLSGYLGNSSRLADFMMDYACAYAQRNAADYAQYSAAIADGRVEVAGDDAL